MSETPSAPAGGGKKENVFTHKIGPLPMWVWVAIAGGGLVIWRTMSAKKAANQNQQAQGQGSQNATPSGMSGTGANNVPQFVNQTYQTSVAPVSETFAGPLPHPHDHDHPPGQDHDHGNVGPHRHHMPGGMPGGSDRDRDRDQDRGRWQGQGQGRQGGQWYGDGQIGGDFNVWQGRQGQGVSFGNGSGWSQGGNDGGPGGNQHGRGGFHGSMPRGRGSRGGGSRGGWGGGGGGDRGR